MIADLRATALCAWADGMLPLEAAVGLLTRAVGGRLLDGPWICNDTDGRFFWFDPDVAAAESGHLSGGERRLLAVARSLASSDHPLDLGDAITGLDHDALVPMLEALAHAGGFTARRPGCDTALAVGARPAGWCSARPQCG